MKFSKFFVIAFLFVFAACSDVCEPAVGVDGVVVPEGAVVFDVGWDKSAERTRAALERPVWVDEGGVVGDTRTDVSIDGMRLNLGWKTGNEIDLWVVLHRDEAHRKVLFLPRRMWVEDGKLRKAAFFLTREELSEGLDGEGELRIAIATGAEFEQGVKIGNGAWFTDMSADGVGQVRIGGASDVKEKDYMTYYAKDDGGGRFEAGHGEPVVIDASSDRYSLPMFSDAVSFGDLMNDGGFRLKALGTFVAVKAKAETAEKLELGSIAFKSEYLRMRGAVALRMSDGEKAAWKGEKPMFTEGGGHDLWLKVDADGDNEDDDNVSYEYRHYMVSHKPEADTDTIGVVNMSMGGMEDDSGNYSNTAFVWVMPDAECEGKDLSFFIRDVASTDEGCQDDNYARTRFFNNSLGKLDGKIDTSKSYGVLFNLCEGNYGINGGLMFTGYLHYIGDTGVRNVFEITNVSNKAQDLRDYYFVRYMYDAKPEEKKCVMPLSSFEFDNSNESWMKNKYMTVVQQVNVNYKWYGLIFHNNNKGLLGYSEEDFQLKGEDLILKPGKSFVIFAMGRSNIFEPGYGKANNYVMSIEGGERKPNLEFAVSYFGEGKDAINHMKEHVGEIPMTGTKSSCYFLTRNGIDIDVNNEQNDIVDNFGMVGHKDNYYAFTGNNKAIYFPSPFYKGLMPSKKFKFRAWRRMRKFGGVIGGNKKYKGLLGDYFHRNKNFKKGELNTREYILFVLRCAQSTNDGDVTVRYDGFEGPFKLEQGNTKWFGVDL